MSKPKLGVFPNRSQSDRRERELDLITGTAKPKTVSVPLGKVVPMLVDAVENDRVWLNDFSDETIQISCDLHEVLLAYHQLRNRAAA
jgi:hypothetical protein